MKRLGVTENYSDYIADQRYEALGSNSMNEQTTNTREEVELPELDVTNDERESFRAEHEYSYLHSMEVTIGASLRCRERQLRDSILACKKAEAESKEKDAKILQLNGDLDGIAGHIGQFKRLVARAEKAEAANREKDAEIERINKLVAYLNTQYAECAELFEKAELASLRPSVGEKWIEIKEGCEMPAVGVRVPIWTTTTGLQIAAYDPNNDSYPWPDGDGRWPARVVSHWKHVAPPTKDKE